MRNVEDVTAAWGGAGQLICQMCQTGQVGHAYLLVGPANSAKSEAADLLAHAAVGAVGEALQEGDARNHPDIHRMAPQSSLGYLVGQIREMLDDVQLAPICSPRKAYVLADAHALTPASANALLKNLEEPPADTVFILLANSADAVLPTIVSRCQAMRFPARSAAQTVDALSASTGKSQAECRRALAFCSDSQQAAQYLADPAKWAIRTLALKQVAGIAGHDDVWAMLQAAELEKVVKSSLDALQQAQEAEYDQAQEILGAGALKEMADRHKRQLAAEQRSGIMAALRAERAFLRDAVLVQTNPGTALACDDFANDVARTAAAYPPEGLLRAIETIGCAMQRIDDNVMPRLAVEGMLLELKEIRPCRP